MEPTGRYLIYEGKQIRLCPPTDGEAAVVIADLPTGRTSTFTLQLLKNNPNFEPFLRYEIVNGPRRGGRHAQALTTSGVRKLVDYLQESKPQPRHRVSNEEATRWIKEELLPELEAMEVTVGRPRRISVGRPMGSVGKPKGSVGKPPSITIKIGRASFSGDILHPDEDTVSVTSGKLSRTWTASQLIEVMEHHRF
jgi:hypothetical protein